MTEVKQTPRNRITGNIADILKASKNFANKYEVKDWMPLIGGTGLGDLFMGKAPELVDDISYDGIQAAIRGGNSATGGIGTYGARPAVMDAAFLGADALGIGKGLASVTRSGSRALINKALEGSLDTGRRDFMKKTGALAAASAAGGSGLGLLRKFTKEGGEQLADIAPKVADNVAMGATKKYKFNTLNDYLDHVRSSVDDLVDEQHSIMAAEEGYYNTPDYDRVIENWRDKTDYGKLIQDKLAQDESSYKIHKQNQTSYNIPERNLTPLQSKLRDKANIYLEENSFSPQAKQEMKNHKDWVNVITYGNDTSGHAWTDLLSQQMGY